MIFTILLVIIYVAFISLGLPDSLLGSAWPSIYEELNVPVSYGGIISMMISGGTIVSSFFSGKVIKKLGTGWTTAISVLMTAVALYGFSIGNSYLFLCLMAIPLGLGAGSVDAALNNFVALHYKARHMSWLHCFWGIGATVGPVIISACLKAGGNWQSGYSVISMIQFALVLVLFVSLPLWKRAGKISEKGGETEADKAQQGTFSLIRQKGAKAAMLSCFFYCAMEASAGLWGSTYLVMVKGVLPVKAAQWISLFYFGITFGRFLSGFLTIRLTNKQVIRMGQSVAMIGVICFFLPFGIGVQLAGLFLTGIGCAPIYPCLLHETPDNFGQEASAGMMGLLMACAYVGTTFMPMLFGFLTKRTGYGLYPVYLGILLAGMVGAVECLNKKVENRKKKMAIREKGGCQE